MVVLESRRRSAVSSVFSGVQDTTSFGPIGRISPVSAGRLKGFIGYVGDSTAQTETITPIENNIHARFIADVVREGIRRMTVVRFDTRLSIRTIVKDSAMAALEFQLAQTPAKIEASMPIGNGYRVVYIGYNDSRRAISQNDARNINFSLDMAKRKYGPESDTLASLARGITEHANTYQIRIVDGANREFTKGELIEIASLLSTFGYDKETALSIVLNERNIIGLVYDGIVVGISITERRDIQLSDGRTLYMAELTDGAVAATSNGKNLYSRLLSEVFRSISGNSPEISLIYAETNVENESLIRTAVLQGRSFGGILPKHAVIKSKSTGELQLKTLAATYLTRSQLAESVERLDAEMTLQQAMRN